MLLYLERDAAMECQAGVTGDVVTIGPTLCERVINENGEAWIAWDNPDRGGMYAYIPESEARELGLI